MPLASTLKGVHPSLGMAYFQLLLHCRAVGLQDSVNYHAEKSIHHCHLAWSNQLRESESAGSKYGGSVRAGITMVKVDGWYRCMQHCAMLAV